MRPGEQEKRGGLEEHPSDDQPLAPHLVRPVPGPDLTDRPDRRVKSGDQSDLSGAGPAGGEVDRNQAPGQGVAEVVDQAGLRARAKRRLAIGGVRKRPTERRRDGVRVGVIAHLLDGH